MSEHSREHREVFRTCAAVCVAAALLAGFALAGPGLAAHRVAVTNSSLLSDGNASLCVSVTDSAGKPIRRLSAANLHASVSGDPADCNIAPTDDGSPIMIVMAVDTSLSLAGGPMRSVIEGAEAFVDQLGPKDAVCLVTFAREVRVPARYTRNHEQLRSIIGGLTATGTNTLLYSALITCSREAKLAPSSRCAVVFLTDGKDEGSMVSLRQAIDEAQKCGVPFYTLGYGSQANNVVLARISELTGGRFRRVASPDQTVALYREIGQELKNQYIVRVHGPFRSGNQDFAVAVDLAGSTSSAHKTIYIPPPPVDTNGSTTAWVLLLGAAVVAAIIIVKRARRSNDNEWGDDEGRDDMNAYDLSSNAGWTTVDTSDLEQTGTSTRNMQVWMEVVKGPHRGAKFVLTGKPVRIGRGTDSDLSLEKDASVSRLHAEITFGNTGEFVLRDADSENGTRIQGNDLGSRSVRLRDGDRISLGASELVYRDERLKHKSR